MKFKSIAFPEPRQGRSFLGVEDQTKPDLSMKLSHILAKFTRGETLPVLHEGYSDESGIDMEKLRYADLTEKDEVKENLKRIQREYERQEKEKKAKADADAKARAQAEYEKKVRLAARKMAKQSSK